MAGHRNLNDQAGRRDERRRWTTPNLKRIRAGSAENAFPGDTDGAFTQS